MELYTFSMNIFMVLCKKLHKNRIIGLKYCINIQNRVYIYTKSESEIMLWQLCTESLIFAVNIQKKTVLHIKPPTEYIQPIQTQNQQAHQTNNQ